MKDFEARQKKEGDLIDEEIVTLLSRLEDELHSSQLEISLTPSDNSVCWMVPGALCLVRESATHRWEDAVITCLEDSVDIVLFNVILIETGKFYSCSSFFVFLLFLFYYLFFSCFSV